MKNLIEIEKILETAEDEYGITGFTCEGVEALLRFRQNYGVMLKALNLEKVPVDIYDLMYNSVEYGAANGGDNYCASYDQLLTDYGKILPMEEYIEQHLDEFQEDWSEQDCIENIMYDLPNSNYWRALIAEMNKYTVVLKFTHVHDLNEYVHYILLTDMLKENAYGILN